MSRLVWWLDTHAKVGRLDTPGRGTRIRRGLGAPTWETWYVWF